MAMLSQLTGATISVREPHLNELRQRLPPLPFIEVVADNYLNLRGPHYHLLRQLAPHYPIVLHCVGLNVGNGGPPADYVNRLNVMAEELNAIAVSDHLSFNRLDEIDSHDLLPIHYSDEQLDRLTKTIEQLQQVLPVPLLLENISRYLCYQDDQFSEGALFAELHRRTGVRLLLDINNLYVTAHNLNLDPNALLQDLPLNAIGYCHLAGHQPQQSLLLDNHGALVAEPVWNLYQTMLELAGPQATVIEWDNQLPSLDTLLAQAALAQTHINNRRPRVHVTNRVTSNHQATLL